MLKFTKNKRNNTHNTASIPIWPVSVFLFIFRHFIPNSVNIFNVFGRSPSPSRDTIEVTNSPLWGDAEGRGASLWGDAEGRGASLWGDAEGRGASLWEDVIANGNDRWDSLWEGGAANGSVGWAF